MRRSLESGTSNRPYTPSVSVTELSGSGQINPTPAVHEDSDHLIDLYLCPEKLKELTGVEDLGQVSALQLCVDTRENTLGNFGSYLPNLLHLKLNNSVIMSVRDLGTTLPHLQTLWMSRCGLADLDGIPSFTCLKELYVAYNDIRDLSQVSLLEGLQVLDLEGNSVDDLTQVQYLGLCTRLSDLTLEGNPVCARPHPNADQMEGYSYRSAVRELIPQLRYLDNVPAEDVLHRSNSATREEEWVLINESIKDSAPSEEEEPSNVPAPSRPGSAHLPMTALPALLSLSRPLGSRPSSSHTRPSSSYSLSSRPGSATMETAAAQLEQDASGLTHGVGRVMCGNPVQVLRAHRQKMGTPATAPHPTSTHSPEHTFDLEETDGKDREDVFAELRAWRKEHSRRLQAIQQERQPQVMKICHSDEDEGEGEEEGMGHSLSLSSEDEGEEEEGGRAVQGCLGNTTSPDSLFNSPPPDLLSDREALSPEISRLSLSPDPRLSPSPPPGLVPPPGGRNRMTAVRARRLRLKHEQGASPIGGGAESGSPTLERRTDEGVPKIRQALATPRRESLRPLSSPVVHFPSSAVGESCKQPISTRSSAPRPLLLPRPLTARAVLQRVPKQKESSPRTDSAHCAGSPSH